MDKIAAAHMMDTLCPMHVVLDATGHIVHAGPTLAKLRPAGDPTGLRFLELVELKRPRIGTTMRELLAAAGVKLHLQLRDPPRTGLKAVLVPLPEGTGFCPAGGAVVNMSFGISILDAVRDFDLTNADFAPTDLAMEMLYLVEAKSAAMEASRKLNLRLQGAKIAAEEQAFTDTLTGLKNRRAMDFVLDRLFETETDFALMNCDLDFFKAVNDTLGHAAGDFVLQTVARIMLEETRRDDTIVRTGGDEFALIFPQLTDARIASEIALRLIKRLEEPIPFNGNMCRISASIGFTLSAQYKCPSIELMMEDADTALYAAKNAGRGRHKVFDMTMRDS
ncbi:GGDEF domain-containing protein [Roseovarius sp. 2305UL8-3]|uniref:GGDEF domain-containing protein n=1 Tax=Roseovarius conchicola TaxID=3121636 RepID=UPI003528911B